MARSQSVDSEMIVIRSEQYHKRMNLMGDLACYGCWAVHLRTPKLDIGVIACRRKFIPPVGDQYQDVFVMLHDDVETREDPISFMQVCNRCNRGSRCNRCNWCKRGAAPTVCLLQPRLPRQPLPTPRKDSFSCVQGLERQADTMSPIVRVPFYDDTITRVKADALIYDED